MTGHKGAGELSAALATTDARIIHPVKREVHLRAPTDGDERGAKRARTG